MSTSSVLIAPTETTALHAPRYTLLLSSDPALIEAAQRLRHQVFATEPGLKGALFGVRWQISTHGARYFLPL